MNSSPYGTAKRVAHDTSGAPVGQPPPRDAMNLVYRAMALEGVNVVESSTSILLVPEGKEPRMNPEILDASRKDIPEGRQRLVKMFPLANVQAADLREKLKGILSDK